MHRLSSHYALRRFRFASLGILLMVLCLPVAAGFFVNGLLLKDVALLRIAGLVLLGSVFLKALTYIISGRLKCPLCMAAPLRKLGCIKHKSAGTFFGSHQMEVAVCVLFKDKFRCPYCGETTGMQVRERRRQPE